MMPESSEKRGIAKIYLIMLRVIHSWISRIFRFLVSDASVHLRRNLSCMREFNRNMFYAKRKKEENVGRMDYGLRSACTGKARRYQIQGPRLLVKKQNLDYTIEWGCNNDKNTSGVGCSVSRFIILFRKQSRNTCMHYAPRSNNWAIINTVHTHIQYGIQLILSNFRKPIKKKLEDITREQAWHVQAQRLDRRLVPKNMNWRKNERDRPDIKSKNIIFKKKSDCQRRDTPLIVRRPIQA